MHDLLTFRGSVDELPSYDQEGEGAFLPFLRTESDFLPDGKHFEDLSQDEKDALRDSYRFDPYRPGLKQGITNIGNRYAKLIFAGYGL